MNANLVPERIPVAARAVEIVRRQIESGAWDAWLPPERELSRLMQIGRNTLRGALATLEAEGWIGPGHRGRRRRVTWRPARGAAPGPASRDIAFLSPYELDALPLYTLREVDALRAALAEQDFRLTVRSSQAFHLADPARVLQRLADSHPAAVWLLHQSPAPVQQWFARAGLPTLIVGYPHADIRLPFVTEDLEATARHAVGRLAAAGHRRIALLCPDAVLAGHRVVAATFRQACARLAEAGEEAPIVYGDGTVRTLCACLDRLLAREPPTAYITLRIHDTVTLVTHLARQGLRIPADASVVCLVDDPTFASIVPAIARYRTDVGQFTRRLFRHAMELSAGATRHTSSARIMSEAVKGESISRKGSGFGVQGSAAE